jgi:lipopolysaccharide export system protein LptC
MTSGQDRMEGEGMIFDNVEQTVELKKNVKTVIQPKANSKNLLTPQ